MHLISQEEKKQWKQKQHNKNLTNNIKYQYKETTITLKNNIQQEQITRNKSIEYQLVTKKYKLRQKQCKDIRKATTTERKPLKQEQQHR